MLFIILAFFHISCIKNSNKEQNAKKCQIGKDGLNSCLYVPKSKLNAREQYKKACTEYQIYGCVLYNITARGKKEIKEANDLFDKVCNKISPFTFEGEVFCSSRRKNLYETASIGEITKFKKVSVPFKSGTKFFISNGAFARGKFHSNRYCWDMTVPIETEVVSIDSGEVVFVNHFNKAHSDIKKLNECGSILIKHKDNFYTNYAHVESLVKVGQIVKPGEVIAYVSRSGFLTEGPHLYFTVYKSIETFKAEDTIPLYFNGIPDGILRTDHFYITP